MWLAKGDYLTCSIGGKQLRPFLPRLHHVSARLGFPLLYLNVDGALFYFFLLSFVTRSKFPVASCNFVHFRCLEWGCGRRSCRLEKRN
ncbi:hypothetical protein POVCU2_0088500 [Plasmodium ovale curtisi]|uniref:Uncharacterized protein n=1 Tax=Plasmodium ovale curtisi TaxID=864141 RepID=A0A1A8WQD2_PLAOA|nr:hypothetical protein POVCU2_0088500 [Plasmodium ovale curtisi]SBT00644.1 hypothetical protein POVCU1_061390 [Plasmodium ovale curtisi]